MDIEVATAQVRLLLEEGLGLDITNPNLIDTPNRIARMYADMFKNIGFDYPDENFTVFPNEKKYDQLIQKFHIPVASMCSHHFLPFFGEAHFGYLPGDKIVGLSKISRIVDHYCKRPQIQESLTHEIINRFNDVVEPVWCMLVMRCVHTCSSIRGAKAKDAVMMTSAISGKDKDNKDIKTEFLSLIPKV